MQFSLILFILLFIPIIYIVGASFDFFSNLAQDKKEVLSDIIGGLYAIGGLLTGFLVFIGVWIYSLSEWGFLLGVAFGWLPAIIVGCITGLLWPLIALFIFFSI